MLRRHFFLVFALGFVLLLAVLGGVKLLMPKSGPGGGGAAAAAGKGGKGGGSGRAPAVAVAVAAVRPFTDRIDAIGVAKARQSVTLTSQTTEIATKILFTSGQSVKLGQVLAQLKTDEQQAAVVNAEAALKKAKSDNDRWQELSRRGFAPKAQVDQMQAAYDQAKANLDAAQSRLHDRVIRAPFSGVIGLSDAAPGMLITPGTPIATLDDISVVYVDFDVPERFIGSIGPGAPIQATADALAGQTLSGRVQRIDTRVKPDTRSVTARAEIVNAGRTIKPGMLLKVSVQQGVRNAIAVPEAAVQFETDQPFVYLIAGQNGHTVAQQKTVVAGARQSGFVEIRAGLSAGDRVVGDGLNRIQPNQPVKVAEAPGGGASRSAAP
ncbi:MAG: efflux RND transporter periplasmic adaptor subunit [Proteobacteria bacterium]|nr:efflux RND transporter periplasmic adaptor subunit [Pseudomonadota bacterium]